MAGAGPPETVCIVHYTAVLKGLSRRPWLVVYVVVDMVVGCVGAATDHCGSSQGGGVKETSDVIPGNIRAITLRT